MILNSAIWTKTWLGIDFQVTQTVIKAISYISMVYYFIIININLHPDYIIHNKYKVSEGDMKPRPHR